MLSWFKKPPQQWKTLSLPGEIGTIAVPETWRNEWDHEVSENATETLLFFPEGNDDVTFRISVLSIVANDDAHDRGIAFVANRATEEGKELAKHEGKVFFQTLEPSEEDGTPLLISYWYVGALNSVCILSATVTQSAAGAGNVRAAMKLAPRIVESISIKKRHREIGDAGEVTITEEVVPQQAQARRPLNDDEHVWLAAALERAAQLSLKYGSGGLSSAAELDAIYSRWLRAEEWKEPAELIIDALGAAFGQLIADQHGFTWVVVTDEWGTEYAVFHPTGETTGFPRASVEKRIAERKEDFFEPIYKTLLWQLERSK